MKSNFRHPGAYNINTTMFQTSECRRLRIGGQRHKKIDELFLDERRVSPSFLMDVSVQTFSRAAREQRVTCTFRPPRVCLSASNKRARLRNALRSTSLIIYIEVICNGRDSRREMSRKDRTYPPHHHRSNTPRKEVTSEKSDDTGHNSHF